MTDFNKQNLAFVKKQIIYRRGWKNLDEYIGQVLYRIAKELPRFNPDIASLNTFIYRYINYGIADVDRAKSKYSPEDSYDDIDIFSTTKEKVYEDVIILFLYDADDEEKMVFHEFFILEKKKSELKIKREGKVLSSYLTQQIIDRVIEKLKKLLK